MISSSFHTSSPRGFTLLIAVVLSSVVLSVGLALADVAYKQVILASTARQSQYAFYAADSALECALYWDQKQDLFDYTSEPVGINPSTPSGTLSCQGQTFSYYGNATIGTSRTTFITIPCAAGGSQSDVQIFKQASGATSIYADGYNNCNASDPQRIERGEKSQY